MKCEQCGESIGFGFSQNSIRIDNSPKRDTEFCITEAVMSYIDVDVTLLDGVKIRKMEELQMRIGSLFVLHLMSVGLILGNDQTRNRFTQILIEKIELRSAKSAFEKLQ